MIKGPTGSQYRKLLNNEDEPFHSTLQGFNGILRSTSVPTISVSSVDVGSNIKTAMLSSDRRKHEASKSP